MPGEEVFDRLVQRWISDESARYNPGELPGRFQLCHHVFRKHEPQFFNALLRIESQPRLFWNLDYFAGRHERRAVVRRRGREDDVVFRRSGCWSFIENVQITLLWTANVDANVVVGFEVDLTRKRKWFLIRTTVFELL